MAAAPAGPPSLGPPPPPEPKFPALPVAFADLSGVDHPQAVTIIGHIRKFYVEFLNYQKVRETNTYDINEKAIADLGTEIGTAQSVFTILIPPMGAKPAGSDDFVTAATACIKAANDALNKEREWNNSKKPSPPPPPPPPAPKPSPTPTTTPKPPTSSSPRPTIADDPQTREKINKVLNTLMSGMECLKNGSSASPPAPAPAATPTKGGAFNKSRKKKSKKSKLTRRR